MSWNTTLNSGILSIGMWFLFSPYINFLVCKCWSFSGHKMENSVFILEHTLKLISCKRCAEISLLILVHFLEKLNNLELFEFWIKWHIILYLFFISLKVSWKLIGGVLPHRLFLSLKYLKLFQLYSKNAKFHIFTLTL